MIKNLFLWGEDKIIEEEMLYLEILTRAYVSCSSLVAEICKQGVSIKVQHASLIKFNFLGQAYSKEKVVIE